MYSVDMRPLLPPPHFPDMAEALRKGTKQGLKQGWEDYVKYEEARIKVKREREESPEDLFVAQESKPLTTLSSGPYAGLKSAKKRVRVRENSDSEEESKATFGLAPDVADEGGVGENVESEDQPEQSNEASKTSFGPAKKVAKTGAALKNVKTVNSRTMKQGPEWYESVDPKQAYSRADMQNLKYLYTLVNNAKKDAAGNNDMTLAFEAVRQRLQQMEFYTSLSPIIIKKSGLLDHGGLRLIFENQVQGVDFPHDIRADADLLFRKWMGGQIDPHLFRGIVTKSGTAKADRGFKSHSIQPDYPGRVSCNYVGAGNLVNGQWWPLQMCAKRDGAHGEIEAGIHGQKGRGAYSVVVSGGGYANVDNGNSIEYCGTQGSQNAPSAGTNLMLEAYATRQPLRVLRSASLPATNAYRPARGIRYDGLYHIISHEIVDADKAMYRFSLTRLGGQDPIRCSGDGSIPSDAQISELNNIRKQIG